MASGDFDETNWLDAANQIYKSVANIRNQYQKKIKKDQVLIDLEQEWVDEYFQPLTSLITSEKMWKCMARFTEIYGLDRKVGQKSIPVSDKCQAHFSGSPGESGHWNARKPGETKWFDPYNEYQIRGTNQFCGVFSMMYLLDRLPPKSGNRTFQRYYIYANAALMFCKDVIDHCIKKKTDGKTRKQWLYIVDKAIANSNAFVNVVEMNPRLIF